ncbi:MAG TPA: hypothetical protein VJG83_01620 [archaeon]|nr:hypothetical protein [archaeon]
MQTRKIKKTKISTINETRYYKRLNALGFLKKQTIEDLRSRWDILKIQKKKLLRELEENDDVIKELELKNVLRDIEFANAEIYRINTGKGKVPRLKVSD